MGDEMGDPRFERVTWDPIFKGIGQKSRKISIDKRFESMFTEPQFRVEYKYDKRGRKVKQSTGEDLRKYYKLDEVEGEGSDVDEVAVREHGVPPPKKGAKSVKKRTTKSVDADTNSKRDGGSVKKGDVRSPEREKKKPAKDKSGKSAVSAGKQKRVESDESADYSGADSADYSGADSADYGAADSSDYGDADSADYGGADSADDSDVESAESDASSTDGDSSEEESSSGLSDEEEEEGGVEVWGEDAPLSEDTSCRLALCNMDWDHVGAKDVFVLLNSFKPAGSSILTVSVYPSDFGLERMATEDIVGPSGLVGGASDEEDQSGEGKEYSKEKLRQYQLNRFKYYYAVVECDRVETAEHIYTHCNGLEYEHSGGRLDLRFIPNDTSFEDRQAKSTATEDLIPADFTPADFVSSALQQSKVMLSWDETDPHRTKVTQKKFTKDDLQSMDFSAYLASSSGSGGDSDEDEDEEEGGGDVGGALVNKKLRYKELLQAEESHVSAKEEMEITWEPGLKESVKKMVKKKKTVDGLTPWEKYLQQKKERRKEVKRKKDRKQPEERAEEELEEGESGFDDPFFRHSVTTATAATTKKKGKRKRELNESEQKERNELELLMMSDGEEEGGGGRSHFSFPAIVRSEKDAGKKRKKLKKGKEEEEHTDDFKVDVSDPRFKAIFESHLYAPDPSHPQYRATQGMADIMEEKQKRRRRMKGKQQQQDVTDMPEKGKGCQQDPTTGQALLDPSLNCLVKSIKTKAELFKGKSTKRKLKLGTTSKIIS